MQAIRETTTPTPAADGLAMVYAKLNRLEEALYFSDLAVEKATRLHQKGYIDQVVLGLVQKTRRSIAES